MRTKSEAGVRGAMAGVVLVAWGSFGSSALRAETTVGGTVATSEWNEAGSPYRVLEDLVLPADATLTILPGVTVLVDSSALIAILGVLEAAGTEEKPVRFLPSVEGETWGGMVYMGAASRGNLEHVEFAHARNPTYGGTTHLGAHSSTGGAKLRISKCWFHDFPNPVIDSDNGSELRVLDTVIERSHEAIHSKNGYALVEGSTVRNVIEYSDSIDYDLLSEPRSVIRNTLIENNRDDDGIDLGGSNALVENVVIRGVRAGKAISIDLAATPELRNVVVDSCMWGLVIKDQATPLFDHCTVTRCEKGIYCFNKIASAGDGGHPVMHSMIVWGNARNTEVDALSTLVLTRSLVQGGFPGDGNLDADPLFFEVAASDFRLAQGSPAIGTGQDGTNMGALPAVESVQGKFVRGEANGDAVLDISDPVRILHILFLREEEVTCRDALDANDDGGVNLTDSLYLLGFLFLSGPSPPAPYPDAGPDPTGDDPHTCAS